MSSQITTICDPWGKFAEKFDDPKISAYTRIIMDNQSNLSELNQYAEVVAYCTCFNLRKASRCVTQIFDEVLQPTGLRITQLTLLVAIALVGEITITHLANELVMDRTTLTRNLKPLVKQGLLTTVTGKDRRTRIVTLTDAGRKALNQALPLWQKAQSLIIERLGRQNWRSLLENLSATVAATTN